MVFREYDEMKVLAVVGARPKFIKAATVSTGYGGKV